MLVPGKWVRDRVAGVWTGYINLVAAARENAELKAQIQIMASTLAQRREDEAEVKRLRSLLGFIAPPDWTSLGARVVARRMGPHSPLETIVIDKGARDGLTINTPAVTHEGVVGRVHRSSASASTLLLIDDPNSKIAVVGQMHRAVCLLAGKGPTAPMSVMYVQVNAVLEEGELLVTSGLDGVFPKGIPAAKVVKVETREQTLFQTVWAQSVLDPRKVEEVMLLKPKEAPVEVEKLVNPPAEADRPTRRGRRN